MESHCCMNKGMTARVLAGSPTTIKLSRAHWNSCAANGTFGVGSSTKSIFGRVEVAGPVAGVDVDPAGELEGTVVEPVGELEGNGVSIVGFDGAGV